MKSSWLLLCVIFQTIFSLSYSLSDIRAVDLRCEYLINPLAVDVTHPRLGWTFEADQNKQNLTQKAYQILVATTQEKLSKNVGDLWDTNKVLSDKNNHIKYNGAKLESGQRAYWAVRVWDQKDQNSDYSSVAFFDKGLDINDWSSQWIGAPAGTQQKALQNLSDIDSKLIQSKKGLIPALYFRKAFQTDSPIKSAKLYSTAHGVYKVLINNQLICDNELSPGWTDYNKTIQYQVYDVTKYILKANALGILLGTGWFSGYVGYNHQYKYFGTEQGALLELHIQYENKSVIIKTDDSWKVTTGPIIYSDMLMGQLYYQNRDLKGWTSPEYSDKSWLSVVTRPINKKVNLVAERAQPIRVIQELKPKIRYESSPGVWVFDFEQNMVGWVRIKLPKNCNNTRVQLKHAEALQPDGTIYTLNLRYALATDTYVLSNDNQTNDFSLEPDFTFHGFRYVEVSGYPGEPQLEDLIGRVISSDTPITGKFQTSNKMVNRLYKNVVWGQRGNFISVPTDCPQRDERLGWMGDAQVFAPTATYNNDVSAFYTKWLRDVRESQSREGGFSDVSPKLVKMSDGAPAWGDAGVIVPYTVYRMYGDLNIIEENYEAMKRWIDYILSVNPNYIWTKRVNFNRGDWLSVGSVITPKAALATGYFAYDSLLLSKMAAAINKTEDANKYRKLHSNIANAFVNTFVNKTDGKIENNTQTDYLIALSWDLLPQSLKPLALNHLVDNIKERDWHLTTGFVGVGYLCPVLTQFGRNDVAYRLLMQDTYPSWGYCIKHNATTIWERWDGWTQEKGFQDPKMNSFNHYSLGSVGRWLFQSVAGIDTDEVEVGFKKIIIRPNPGNGLTFVNSEYNSINGLIKSYWNQTKGQFTLKVSIPVNTRAVIDLRFSRKGGVHEIGSGTYHFTIKDE